MILFPKLEKHPYYSENIYNWVDPNTSKGNQTARSQQKYKSQYDSQTKQEFYAPKSPIPKTMGYAHTPLRSPHDYLKKHTRETKIEITKTVQCTCRERTTKDLPPVQKPKTSPPLVRDSFKRNYVAENALNVLRRPPTNPTPKYIDSRNGDSFALMESGRFPYYSLKEGYGELPLYINKIQKNLKTSNEEFVKYITAEYRNAEPQRLSDETKNAILEGLVTNLKKILKLYMALPLNIESPLDIQRKTEYEKKIDSLQRDIDLIQRNKEILIKRER